MAISGWCLAIRGWWLGATMPCRPTFDRERDRAYCPSVTRTVICISHTTAAGGQDVGRLVAERLGYRLVDEEIVARAAEKQKVSPADLVDVERRKSRLERILSDIGWATEAGPYIAYSGMSPESHDPNSLRALIRQAITETAAEGKVVIVSHAASYTLGIRPDALRVFVTAPMKVRLERLAAAEGLEEKAASKSIASNDAGRADYLKRFYGVDAELPTHYDVVLNTDGLDADKVADLVVHAASL